MANEHVAISTQGVQLLRGDSKTTLKELCWIQEYPDLIEDPDTIDVSGREQRAADGQRKQHILYQIHRC